MGGSSGSRKRRSFSHSDGKVRRDDETTPARFGEDVTDLFWACDVAAEAEKEFCDGKAFDCNAFSKLNDPVSKSKLINLQTNCPAACGLCPKNKGFSYSLPCPKGYTCTGSEGSPVACPPGDVQPKIGNTACTQCIGDSLAPGEGGVNCLKMKKGFFGAIRTRVLLSTKNQQYFSEAKVLEEALELLREMHADFDAKLISSSFSGEFKNFIIEIEGVHGARKWLEKSETTRTPKNNTAFWDPEKSLILDYSLPPEPKGYTLEKECPRGMKCVDGSRIACPNNTYQIHPGSDDCIKIPPGFVGQDQAADLGGNINISFCPEEFICIDGQPRSCDPGFFAAPNRSVCLPEPAPPARSSNDAGIASATNLAAVAVCIVVIIIVVVMVLKRGREKAAEKTKKR
jgi:hypothetical protein